MNWFIIAIIKRAAELECISKKLAALVAISIIKTKNLNFDFYFIA